MSSVFGRPEPGTGKPANVSPKTGQTGERNRTGQNRNRNQPVAARRRPWPPVAARGRPWPPVAARGRIFMFLFGRYWGVKIGNAFMKKLGSDFVVQSSRSGYPAQIFALYHLGMVPGVLVFKGVGIGVDVHVFWGVNNPRKK